MENSKERARCAITGTIMGHNDISARKVTATVKGIKGLNAANVMI